jgi:putative PEP-CTERM system TPR-repeat lipoprotein
MGYKYLIRKEIMKRIFCTLIFFMGLQNSSSFAEESYLKEAQNYLDKGEVKSAVIQLKNLLKENPLDAEGRLLLGKSYLKLGDGPSAVKELEKARDLHLAEEKWIIPLSKAYLIKGDIEKVLKEPEEGSSFSKETRAELLALKGMARLSKGDKELASEKFNAALAINPKSSEALLGLARIAFQNKEFDEAKKRANEVLVFDASHVGALLILGEAERLSGQNDQALEHFNQVLKLNKDNLQGRLARATTYISKGDLASAQKDVDSIKKTYGEMPFVEYLNAVIAFQNKELQKAEDSLTKVLNAAPNHPQSLLLMGSVAYAQGKLETAENNLSRYLKIAPRHLPAIKLLAAARMKLKQPKQALEILQTVEASSQSDPQFMALLGSAYMQNNQLDKGTEALEKAAKLAPDVAAIQTQLALGHIASGKVDQAVGNLEHAVSLDQGVVQADVMLVMAQVQQKKYDQAIKTADKLSSKMPDNPMPYHLKAAAYKAKGDKTNARKQWQLALEKKADYATAAINLANLALEEGDTKAAEIEYQKLLKNSPENLSALIGLAQLSEKRRDYAAMERWLNKAHDLNPKALQPSIMLSRYHLAKNEPMKALEKMREAHSNNEDNPMALYELGKVQLAAGQNSNAIHSFRKLEDKAKNNPELFFLLGKALKAEKSSQEAVAAWEKAVSIKTDYLPAEAALAEESLQQKQFDKAEQLALEIQKKHPQSSLGFRFHGDSYRGRKQNNKALEAYKKAFKIAPNSYLAQQQFLLLKQAGEMDKAFSLLEAWSKNDQNDLNAMLMLAMAHQEKGHKQKAVDYYEKILEKSANNTLVLNNLAWLYQELGDKRAVATAEKALVNAENSPEVADTAGWILIQNNQVNKGLVILQQAAVQAPHIAAIRVHLAEALVKAGRKDEARKELTRLLKEKKRFAERAEAEKLLESLK